MVLLVSVNFKRKTPARTRIKAYNNTVHWATVFYISFVFLFHLDTVWTLSGADKNKCYCSICANQI